MTELDKAFMATLEWYATIIRNPAPTGAGDQEDAALQQLKAAVAQYVVGEDEDTRDPANQWHTISRPIFHNELRAQQRKLLSGETK